MNKGRFTEEQIIGNTGRARSRAESARTVILASTGVSVLTHSGYCGAGLKF
jgi:hypothetical protein